jgi:quercetin dioxygenase-like cupin family protein
MQEDAEENVQGAHSSKAPGDFEGGIILDLNDQIDQLFSDTSNKEEAGRKSKMLMKYPELRVVLIAMRAASRWNDHKTQARISVQVLRGHIQFHVLNETFDLRAGQLLALDPGVVHSVDSVADSAFLLTLSDPAAHQ